MFLRRARGDTILAVSRVIAKYQRCRLVRTIKADVVNASHEPVVPFMRSESQMVLIRPRFLLERPLGATESHEPRSEETIG